MSVNRIAIFCGGPFAFPVLMKLAFEKYLCGIVLATRDERLAENIKEESVKNNFPFLHISSRKDMELLNDWMDEVKPDAVFSICFPYQITSSILQKAPDRFFNFHPGPLPAFRGPTPIFEVLRQNTTYSAVSVHFMDEAFDSGKIIFTEKVLLDKNENYLSLTQKLSTRTGIAALNLAEMLQFGSGNIHASEQDESLAGFYVPPKETDLEIDPDTMPAEKIIALINACHGWTRGAVIWMNDEKLRIPAAHISTELHSGEETPGTVVKIEENGTCTVICLDKKLLVIPEFSSDYGNPGLQYLREIGLRCGIKLSRSPITEFTGQNH
jgi:methionyl-tRNA formyltransferase